MKHVEAINGSVNEKEDVTEGDFELIVILEGTADEYFLMQAKDDNMKALSMRNKFKLEGTEPVVIFVFKHTHSDLKFREFDQLEMPGHYQGMPYYSTYGKLSTYGDVKIGMVVHAKQEMNKKGKNYLKVQEKAAGP